MTTLIFYVWVCVQPLDPHAALDPAWTKIGADMRIELHQSNDPPDEDRVCERIAGPLRLEVKAP